MLLVVTSGPLPPSPRVSVDDGAQPSHKLVDVLLKLFAVRDVLPQTVLDSVRLPFPIDSGGIPSHRGLSYPIRSFIPLGKPPRVVVVHW